MEELLRMLGTNLSGPGAYSAMTEEEAVRQFLVMMGISPSPAKGTPGFRRPMTQYEKYTDRGRKEYNESYAHQNIDGLMETNTILQHLIELGWGDRHYDKKWDFSAPSDAGKKPPRMGRVASSAASKLMK
jgi:hypothetical protein